MLKTLERARDSYRRIRRATSDSLVTQTLLARVGIQPGPGKFLVGPLRIGPEHEFLDLDVEADLTWEQTRQYEYSKLYYTGDLRQAFDESRVICFRLPQNGKRQTLRLALPDFVERRGRALFRLDGLPYSGGALRLHGCRLAAADDGPVDLTFAAQLDALKAHTRAEVLRSERQQRDRLPHYPESLGLELQAACNLKCCHCSSHGTPELHRKHNAMGEMDIALLRKLAHEVFPHLTMVNVVGRGESLMVSDALWSEFVGLLARYRVLCSIVTNGYFVERRLTRDVLPLIDTLTVSIDGLKPDTVAANRGGGQFDRILAGVRHFHQLRKELCLPRRPKLCISWTLKKNNIAEFPDFVRFISQFEPDRFYVRHLLLFRESDAEQSLLDAPELANRYLSEAYALFEQYGIETDCPPLFDVKADAPSAAPTADVAVPTADVAAPATVELPLVEAAAAPCADSPGAGDSYCTYIHRTGSLLSGGEMSTCGVQYADSVGKFSLTTDFESLWNSPAMQSVRRDLNTPNEWRQCRDCWFRQSRYHEQRQQRSERRQDSLYRTTSFSKKAWDFRGYEG